MEVKGRYQNFFWYSICRSVNPNIPFINFYPLVCLSVCLFQDHAKVTKWVQTEFSLFRRSLLNLKTKLNGAYRVIDIIDDMRGYAHEIIREYYCRFLYTESVLQTWNLAKIFCMHCRCSFMRKVHENKLVEELRGYSM